MSRTNVPRNFVRSIAPGQGAQVLVPEFPKRAFVGKIASTAGALDPTSRTLLTEVRPRNEDRALGGASPDGLKDGMRVVAEEAKRN